MPTYEYRCPKGHVFEKFSPQMTSSRRLKCPTCGRLAERLISGGSGLVFKGSGFYITDYKRAGTKPADGESQPETKPKDEKSKGDKPKDEKPKATKKDK
jgi:putative FmdB family regulatory protein